VGTQALLDDRITRRSIHCIIKVHHGLGPGFLESIYRRALLIELEQNQLSTEVEKEIPVYYCDKDVGRHRLDLLVEGRVIIELKTVETLSRAHYAQVRSYLKATNLDTALLVNFNDQRVDFRRIERESSPPTDRR
jgi:GxxExxY protein